MAAKDVGLAAAELIQQDQTGVRVVQLEGPDRVSPNDLADAFASAIGKSVRAVPVPRESWEQLFRSQGMKNPQPRIRMLDGFNEGWIEFNDSDLLMKGSTGVAAVVETLIASADL